VRRYNREIDGAGDDASAPLEVSPEAIERPRETEISLVNALRQAADRFVCSMRSGWQTLCALPERAVGRSSNHWLERDLRAGHQCDLPFDSADVCIPARGRG
jgi:hypothetical protein